MKNIFVEGIQGMGKSTLLSNLGKKSPELQVCREGDYSPIDLAWCTWLTKEEYHQLLKKYETLQDEIKKNTIKEDEHYIVTYTKILTDIPNFHKDLEKYEIYNGRKSLQEFEEIIFSRYSKFSESDYLFECSFFQNIIEDLILFHQLCDDDIINFYQKLFTNIDKETFCLLYLYSDNLEENIKTVKKERCDEHGNEIWYTIMLKYLKNSPYGKQHGYSSFDDMIAHFKHRQQLELRIIKEVIKERALVLPAKNWNIDEIITFVNS